MPTLQMPALLIDRVLAAAANAPQTRRKPGDMIADRYELLELVSVGRSSVKAEDTSADKPRWITFRARDQAFGRDATLRLRELTPEGIAAVSARMSSVVEKMSALDHPNVDAPMDVGIDDTAVFVVSAVVGGFPLRTLLSLRKRTGRRFDPESLGSLVRPLFEAVEAIHAWTPHGRLSLDNIMVSSEGLKVTELILGELVPPESYEADADFAAPEVRDGAEPNIASDIYSLGRVVKALIANAGFEVPNSQVADDLRGVLAVATDPESSARFDSARALGSALLAAIGVQAGDVPAPDVLDPSYRTRRKTDPGMPTGKNKGPKGSVSASDAVGLAALIAGAVEEAQAEQEKKKELEAADSSLGQEQSEDGQSSHLRPFPPRPDDIAAAESGWEDALGDLGDLSALGIKQATDPEPLSSMPEAVHQQVATPALEAVDDQFVLEASELFVDPPPDSSTTARERRKSLPPDGIPGVAASSTGGFRERTISGARIISPTFEDTRETPEPDVVIDDEPPVDEAPKPKLLSKHQGRLRKRGPRDTLIRTPKRRKPLSDGEEQPRPLGMQRPKTVEDIVRAAPVVAPESSTRPTTSDAKPAVDDKDVAPTQDADSSEDEDNAVDPREAVTPRPGTLRTRNKARKRARPVPNVVGARVGLNPSNDTKDGAAKSDPEPSSEDSDEASGKPARLDAVVPDKIIEDKPPPAVDLPDVVPATPTSKPTFDIEPDSSGNDGGIPILWVMVGIAAVVLVIVFIVTSGDSDRSKDSTTENKPNANAADVTGGASAGAGTDSEADMSSGTATETDIVESDGVMAMAADTQQSRDLSQDAQSGDAVTDVAAADGGETAANTDDDDANANPPNSDDDDDAGKTSDPDDGTTVAAVDPEDGDDDDDEPEVKMSCPSGMKLIKKGAQPYCIDRFEFPGKGLKPRVRVSQDSAGKMCEGAGKRLCKASEWKAACGKKFPYGRSYKEGRCNDGTMAESKLLAAGNRKCRSRTGTLDMVGNAAEWVEEGYALGGSFKSGGESATCGAKSSSSGSSDDVGFRCCTEPFIDE